MKPIPPSELTIRLHTPYSSESLATSEVIINNLPTGLIVDGEVLEAAVKWRDRRIIFLTDNILHEDMLRIYLLDADHRVIDRAVLGAAYSSGAFSGLTLIPPDSLSFEFIGGTSWRLVIFPEQEFAVPCWSDPRGVSRPWKFFRYFRLEGKPLPDIPDSKH